MRPTALLLSLLALGATFARADTQPAQQGKQDPIRITSLNDGRFRFTLGGHSAVLDLRGSIGGCTASLYDGGSGQQYGGSVRARVLDEVQRAGWWYVLMQVNTNSGCNVQGLCGAGFSTDLIWLKLDVGLKAAARQTARVEDCLTNTELTRFVGKQREGDSAALEMRGGVLSLEASTTDYTAKKVGVLNLRYDRRSPERGLLLTRTTKPLN